MIYFKPYIKFSFIFLNKLITYNLKDEIGVPTLNINSNLFLSEKSEHNFRLE